MPHLVIEYSVDGHSEYDIGLLLPALHATAASTGIMQAADIKIRATGYDRYLVAGKRDSFCHLTVYLLAGRTLEQKVHLSEALRASLAARLPQTRSLSVDIRDMDPVAYKKRLNGD